MPGFPGGRPKTPPESSFRPMLLWPMPSLKTLLWIDCTAAVLAGSAVVALTLTGFLPALHALPREFLLLLGTVNLLYGSYSFSLAVQRRSPKRWIAVLVLANLFWAAMCLGFSAVFFGSATPFGMVHLTGEAIFVGGLALFEWRALVSVPG